MIWRYQTLLYHMNLQLPFDFFFQSLWLHFFHNVSLFVFVFWPNVDSSSSLRRIHRRFRYCDVAKNNHIEQNIQWLLVVTSSCVWFSLFGEVTCLLGLVSLRLRCSALNRFVWSFSGFVRNETTAGLNAFPVWIYIFPWIN